MYHYFKNYLPLLKSYLPFMKYRKTWVISTSLGVAFFSLVTLKFTTDQVQQDARTALVQCLEVKS
jgi:hypothetical protein